MTSTPEDLAADLAAIQDARGGSWESHRVLDKRRWFRWAQVVRELIEARDEIERLELQLAISVNQISQAKALLQDRDAEIERLRAMLLRWVPRPSLQVYGFHKRDQPEECEKQLVRDACEIHGVPVPEHCQERKDGAK